MGKSFISGIIFHCHLWLPSQHPNFDGGYPSLMLPLHWPLYLAPPSTSISGFSTRSANFAPAQGSRMFRVPIPDTRMKCSSFVLALLGEAANTKAVTNRNRCSTNSISHRCGFAKQYHGDLGNPRSLWHWYRSLEIHGPNAFWFVGDCCRPSNLAICGAGATSSSP